jgi:hypothetical protein
MALKNRLCKSDEEQQYIDDYFHKHIKFDEDKFDFVKNIGFITLIYGKVFDSRFLGSYKFAY